MTPQISIRFDEDRLAEIEARAEEEGVTRSGYIRDSIDAREQLAECRRENERLERRVRKLIEQREEHDELVRYVEEERLDRQRERERSHAPAWRRAKWWLFGTPEDEPDA